MALLMIYDKSADAAYIYLRPRENPPVAWVTKTHSAELRDAAGMINLDFDSNGNLGGIEIVFASKILPQAVLDQAERLDGERLANLAP